MILRRPLATLLITTHTGKRFRLSVALLLCPALFLQACATVGPAPPGAALSRSVVDGTIGLHADPETASHLANAADVTQLRDPRVIPLSVVVRNVGSAAVFIESALMALQLTDGRLLRVAESVQRAKAPAFEPEPATGGLNWIGGLGQAIRDIPPLLVVGMVVVVGTKPLWLPPYLITRHVKQESHEQRDRNAALAQLAVVRLDSGQTAGTTPSLGGRGHRERPR